MPFSAWWTSKMREKFWRTCDSWRRRRWNWSRRRGKPPFSSTDTGLTELVRPYSHSYSSGIPYSLFSYLYFHRSAVQYQVINDVSRLSNDEMERIVAVFVHVSCNFKFKKSFSPNVFYYFLWFQGPVWQFKGWNYFGLNDQRKMVNKWDSKPVNIFSDVQAFHIYYDDIKVSFSFRKRWLWVHCCQERASTLFSNFWSGYFLPNATSLLFLPTISFRFWWQCTRRQKFLLQSKLIKHWIVLEVFIFSIIPVAKYSFGEGFTTLNSRSRINFQIEPNVLKWNVEKIPVSRMKRYKDKANLARVRSNLNGWQNTHWWP